MVEAKPLINRSAEILREEGDKAAPAKYEEMNQQTAETRDGGGKTDTPGCRAKAKQKTGMNAGLRKKSRKGHRKMNRTTNKRNSRRTNWCSNIAQRCNKAREFRECSNEAYSYGMKAIRNVLDVNHYARWGLRTRKRTEQSPSYGYHLTTSLNFQRPKAE